MGEGKMKLAYDLHSEVMALLINVNRGVDVKAVTPNSLNPFALIEDDNSAATQTSDLFLLKGLAKTMKTVKVKAPKPEQ